MNVSEYIFARLAQEGVKDVFLLPGGGCMHLVDALGRENGIRQVPLLHEQSVGIAADAYAQVANSLGVALVTTGPGGTNTVTAVAGAWLDSTPCMFISGQVKLADLAGSRGVRQFGFQEIDITSIVSPITKYAKTVHSAGEAVEAFETALELALSDRPGPVWLDIPLDVQSSQITNVEETEIRPKLSRGAKTNGNLSDSILASLIDALGTCTKPAILLGNGVRLAKAEEDAINWARAVGIPVLTTWKSLDLIPDDDPLYAGRPGGVGSFFANKTLQESDLLLCVGARLDLGQVGYRHDTFARSAAVYVVDVDETELNKLEISNQTLLQSDAREFFVRVSELSAGTAFPSWQDWRNQIQEWKTAFPLFLEEERYWTDGVSLYSMVEALSELMSEDDVLAPGSSGACSEISMQAFKVKAGQRVMNSEGLGSMGFGVPSAIGACIASNQRRTVCIDGDGGFAMNLQDLSSVSRMQLPITFIVLDNDGYGSIQTTQDRYFEGRRVASDRESGIELPHYDNLEAVFGIPTERAKTLAEFKKLLEKMLGKPGPNILIVDVSPRHETRFRVQTKFDASGKPQTSELDDLWYPKGFPLENNLKLKEGDGNRGHG